MKIGILTFHRSINYGAVMQCYALQQRLKEDFPNDEIEVIDYIPQSRYQFYKPTLANYFLGGVCTSKSLSIKGKIILDKLRHIKNYKLIKNRYFVFQESLDCLSLSKDFYCTDDVEIFRNAISGKYDVIIVGSDCVWEWPILGVESAYYLSGNYQAHKVSYAACSGTNDYLSLDNREFNYLSQAISSFEYIGVRDTATEYNVEGLCPDVKVFRNCDPTTLINPDDLKEYRERLKDRLTFLGKDNKKPVIGLMCNEIIGKLAYDIFGESVTYVGVYTPNKYANIFLGDLKVLEWASIFGLFDITFTTFFHGTMLSLVNKTPVLSFDYYESNEKHLSKIGELYQRLDLPGFYHKGKRTYDNNDIEDIGKVAHDLLENPPKDVIAGKIKKEAESYITFRVALEELHNKN